MKTFFSPLLGGLVIGMKILVFSGCVEAQTGAEPKDGLEKSRTTVSETVPEEKVPDSLGSEAPGLRTEKPTVGGPLSPTLSKQQVVPAASAEERQGKRDLSAAPNQAVLPPRSSSPSSAKPSEEKPTPIYGLPLEYHFQVPEVPERIRGPTPMPVVSKPATPGPHSKHE